jgi:hypothetical protein
VCPAAQEEIMSDHKEIVRPTKARQGVTGHNVRYVLALSLGGAAIALLIVVFAFIL